MIAPAEPSTILLKDIKLGGTGDSAFPAGRAGFTKIAPNTFAFQAYDGDHGHELWVTDGTEAGTKLVKDIYEGWQYSNAFGFTPLGTGKAVFLAETAEHGRELWITDGTEAGTQLLKNIKPGAESGDSWTFGSLGNGQIIFAADDGVHGRELWITDGTEGGTKLLKDTTPGSEGFVNLQQLDLAKDGVFGDPGSYTVEVNGQVLFKFDDGIHGIELWVTDGTTAGTKLLKDINPGAATSGVRGFADIGNGKLLFGADDGTNGRELWVTDGTEEGTVSTTSLFPANNNLSLFEFAALGNGQFVFVASDETHGNELWVTDGTSAGTEFLKDINPGSEPGSITDLTAISPGVVVFTANDGTHGPELWVTDGTSTGTKLLKDILEGTVAGRSVRSLAAVGDGLALFSGEDGVHGKELWVTDGTTEGTRLVEDIHEGGFDSAPSDFIPLGNGQFLFQANDGVNGREPWITNAISSIEDPEEPPVDPPVDPPIDPPVGPPVDPPIDPPVDPPTDLESVGRLGLLSEGTRLLVESLDEVGSLHFSLENWNLSNIAEMIVSGVYGEGAEKTVGQFSLLDGAELGEQFAQAFSIAANLLAEGMALTFQLLDGENSQTGSLTLGESGKIGLSFGDRTLLFLFLQAKEAVNLLTEDASSIDLSNHLGEDVSMAFTVFREANFDNTLKFYQTDDVSGGIFDELTGLTINPGDDGYEAAALARQVEISLTGQNRNAQTFSATLEGGGFLSMFLIADGSDPEASELYFSHAGMNNVGDDHAKLLGNNLFGFEDMAGLGDKDFNDLVVHFEMG
ncbi:MAG: DUF4114 domain-containing protein [Cyanobacteria bacterium J06623_4]